jgi:hypothetical protein
MGFYTRFTDPLARKEITRYYQFLKRYDEIYRGNTPYAEATRVYPRTAVFRGDLAPVEAFRAEGKKLLDEHVLFDVVSDERGREEFSPRKPFPTPSKFDAPKTVRVSASRPAKGTELDFHFVNYNREEPPKDAAGNPGPGSGIAEEKPLAVKEISANVIIPSGSEVVGVVFITPEQPEASVIEFTAAQGRLKFKTPEFLVYGVVRVKLKP